MKLPLESEATEIIHFASLICSNSQKAGIQIKPETLFDAQLCYVGPGQDTMDTNCVKNDTLEPFSQSNQNLPSFTGYQQTRPSKLYKSGRK